MWTLIRSQGVASGLIEVGGFLSNKSSPAKVTTLSNTCAAILSFKISVTATLMKYVAGSNSRSYAVTMTILADSELRRNKLVLCFLTSILLRIDHSLGFICSWKSCPRGIHVPSKSTSTVSKRTKWIDCDPVTVALQMHVCGKSFLFGPHNTPFWVCCSVSFMTTSVS